MRCILLMITQYATQVICRYELRVVSELPRSTEKAWSGNGSTTLQERIGISPGIRQNRPVGVSTKYGLWKTVAGEGDGMVCARFCRCATDSETCSWSENRTNRSGGSGPAELRRRSLEREQVHEKPDSSALHICIYVNMWDINEKHGRCHNLVTKIF